VSIKGNHFKKGAKKKRKNRKKWVTKSLSIKDKIETKEAKRK
jgi:hypothetical protein